MVAIWHKYRRRNGDIEKVGSHQPLRVDVRVIAATNKNIEKAIEEQNFRHDLYYCINVITVKVPSLRDHREDIPLLVRHFLKLYGRRSAISEKSFSDKAIQELVDYSWHGNIRELKNLMERIAVMSSS